MLIHLLSSLLSLVVFVRVLLYLASFESINQPGLFLLFLLFLSEEGEVAEASGRTGQ